MKYENFSFQEALETLADRAGIALPKMNYSEEVKRREEKRKTPQGCQQGDGDLLLQAPAVAERQERPALFRGQEAHCGTMRDFRTRLRGGHSGTVSSRTCADAATPDDVILEAGVAVFDEKRGLHDKFWNRVIFPIMDVRGQVIGFGGRVMGDGKPKYLNSPETEIFDKSRNLYGLHIAKRSNAPYKILCEGYMDVISMHQAEALRHRG